jgi:hypothetical protein
MLGSSNYPAIPDSSKEAQMNFITLLIALIPEVVRGVIGICRDKYAAQKAEDERKKAEAERDARDSEGRVP